MEMEFVKRFDDARCALRRQFANEEPRNYEDIVRSVVKIIQGDDKYGVPDPDRIHVIDDGDYQGTLVFVIGEGGYQPSNYWYVMVSYGSCSGCDTLEHVLLGDGDSVVDGLMVLALHIVQGIKPMGEAVA